MTGTAASALTSVVAFLFVIVARRSTIATLRWHWVLPGIAVTAGVTNLGFVWGTIHGEVLRVMLLFYLTPRGPPSTRISCCASASRGRARAWRRCRSAARC